MAFAGFVGTRNKGLLPSISAVACEQLLLATKSLKIDLHACQRTRVRYGFCGRPGRWLVYLFTAARRGIAGLAEGSASAWRDAIESIAPASRIIRPPPRPWET